MTDIVVIGAGPAGVLAAIRAAELGANTALVSSGEFGGMAANDGPVPVRTLARAARLIREARQLNQYGVAASEVALDYPRLLARVREVVADVRHLAQASGCPRRACAVLPKVAAYLERNVPYMDYAAYLARGWPIATGVIEGACRHLVKDRLERAGMRWKVPGAQAMLELRTVYANGDWDAFQAYRVEHENKRLYPHAEVLEQVPWPIAA